MYGGQFSQANNIWNGVSISLFGTSGFKMAHNTQITTSSLTIAGGKLYNDVAENLTVNGTELIFGAIDEASATFKAASAHSIEMGNKLNVWDGGENRTNFRFNIGKENLIVSNEAANLRANAFVYSANEIEFHETSSGETTTRVSVQLDFSNIDFSGLDGDYYVSLFAMERDFHTNVEPVFSYADAEGLFRDINYAETYKYGDILSFEVIHDLSSYSYYIAMHVASVPEPSACAAIIGALALLGALVRGRGQGRAKPAE